MSLGQNIRRLRRDAGLDTQKALADLLGVPQPQVSDWENDRYSVLETLTLVKIAKGLRCSVDELLVGVDPDYDRVREACGVAGAAPERIESPIVTPAGIPVVAEGDASPAGLSWDDRGAERTGVVHWVSRPRDLRDPDAYGILISGDSMVPAHRPKTVAIAVPSRRVQDGDEVYVELASGGGLIRLARTTRLGYMLQAYNHAYKALLVQRRDIRAMDVIVSSRLREF